VCVKNIPVAIAGIYENCSNLKQQNAPHKNKILHMPSVIVAPIVTKIGLSGSTIKAPNVMFHNSHFGGSVAGGMEDRQTNMANVMRTFHQLFVRNALETGEEVKIGKRRDIKRKQN
jgi:hypothetical protein